MQTENVPDIVLASIQGDIDAIDDMDIYDSVDINAVHPATKRTALIEASARGFSDIVDLLCLINDVEINATDIFGVTALMKASERGYEKIVESLILFGADVNIVAGWKQHITAIRLAYFNGHKRVVKMLKAEGACLNFGED